MSAPASDAAHATASTSASTESPVVVEPEMMRVGVRYPVHIRSPFVSVDWLERHALDRSGKPTWYDVVHIIDASWFLPVEKQDAKANFEREHIPNAVFFDLDACTSKEDATLPHKMPTASQFAEYASSFGISRDDAIVVYDTKGCFSAPKVRQMFQHFGATKIAILDGGLKAWIKDQNWTYHGPAHMRGIPKKLSFEPKVRDSDFLIDLASVEENSDSNNASFTLFDARPPGRFNGTELEPRSDVRSGHIEGAVNVPWTLLLTTDGNGSQRMKSPEELAKVFEDIGFDVKDEDQRFVVMCGTGVTACIVLLALEVLGRTNTKSIGLYDGSWTEWALKRPYRIVSAATKKK